MNRQQRIENARKTLDITKRGVYNASGYEMKDNTIVIFYSDNEGSVPRGKREIMDSGSLVPFIIAFPDGREAGTVNEERTDTAYPENLNCCFKNIFVQN